MMIKPSNVRKKVREPLNVTKKIITCDVETTQCDDRTVKCEEKNNNNKGTTECDKRTVTCNIRTT